MHLSGLHRGLLEHDSLILLIFKKHSIRASSHTLNVWHVLGAIQHFLLSRLFEVGARLGLAHLPLVFCRLLVEAR